MQSPQAPQQIQNVLEPIAAALAALDYAPKDMVWNAALRMFQAPELAQDMIDYVYAGMPAPDFKKQTPPSLFRPLPGNYTVAALMRDFQFEAVGAYLMGAELTYNTAEAIGILNKFIEEGFRKTLPDGTRILVTLPIAEKYPLCPNCALRWTQSYETCPRCGYGPEERMIDEGQIPPRIMQTLPTRPPAAPELQCSRCGALMKAGTKFCGSCGASLGPAVPPAASALCSGCGQPLASGVRFCTRCGKAFN